MKSRQRLSLFLIGLLLSWAELLGAAPGTPLWTFPTDAPVATSVAIGADGTLYFGNDGKKLYAVGPDHQLKWTFLAGDAIRSSPAVGADGTIYFGCDDKRLYAVSPQGSLRWSFLSAGLAETPPAIGSDGTIYFSIDGQTYAIAPDGKQRWNYPIGTKSTGAPVLGTDGTVFIGGGANAAHALKPDGTKLWSRDLGAAIFGLSLAGDGTVLVSTGGTINRLFALDSHTGTNRWAYQAGGNINSSAAVGPDGAIYFGAADSKLYALNPNGTLRWKYSALSTVQSPAITVDGTAIFNANDHTVTAVDAAGKQRWQFLAPNSLLGSPTIGPGGTIYFGCFDRQLYALTGDGDLADSPWPMYRGDYRHTANLAVSAPPLVQLQQPLAGDTVYYGNPVLFKASVESLRAVPARVDFYTGGTLLGSVTNRPFDFSWTNPPLGSLVLSAVAMDASGRLATSAPVTLMYNTRITARLTNPAPDLHLLLPGVLQLGADVQSPDAPITDVQFFAGINLLGDVTASPYTLAVTNPPAGKFALTVHATDALGGSIDSAPVNVAIYAPGDFDPLADSFSGTEDTVLGVPAPGVLANDINNGAGVLSADLVMPPTKGTVSLQADGSFQYQPATNANGLDSFSYRLIASGRTSAPTVVQLIVQPVNDPPTLEAQDYLVDQNGYLDRLITASDVDSSLLTFRISVEAAHGSAQLEGGDATSIHLVYQPAHNYTGPDSVVLVVNDGQADSLPTTVQFRVRPVPFSPVALADQYQVETGAPLVVAAANGVLANDYDDNGDLLHVQLVSLPQHGQLTLQNDGSFRYVPAVDFVGADGFTYMASDGQLHSATTSVALLVGNERWLPHVSTNRNLGISQLVVSGTNLYVGGTFTSLDGVPVNRVAHWDGHQWSPLVGALLDGVNNDVYAMAAGLHGDLYVGGNFTTAGGRLASHVAHWDGETWTALGGGVNRAVYALAVAEDGRLYAGGQFTTAGPVNASALAVWNGTAWSKVGGGINDNSFVGALLPSGTNLYVGGGFYQAGPVAVSNVARWDGQSWDALGGGIETLGTVRALALSGSNLVVGGQFKVAGGQPAINAAQWDGSHWTALATSMDGFGLVTSVTSLVVNGPDLYMGGEFRQLNGISATGVARWDGSRWHPLGTGTDANNQDDMVQALAIKDQQLFVAGTFVAAGGKTTPGFARWLLAPELTWEVHFEGAALHAVSTATDGARYHIERSADLQTWQPVQTLEASEGRIEFIDPTPGTAGSLFIRARLAP